ncbi:helix-turn-helix domain-containing protein [Marinobacter halodurans]|uniref:Helix-turn-helix domain-containing protein n=1 Tax=Marinobacter halodurans TaxID=2528979 RepID=A0ABY1ZES9_9GAMM|nr:helix-turn-helix domain-containing protein [Marinobacter halodurans]TBW48864.1 helix-turn-helix domain-containing protein [Marinobacter halodurans]
MHHKTKKVAPVRCTAITDDAHEQADNLTNWDQQYDQVSPGRFYGRIDELHLGAMQVYNEHSSHALRQQCLVWPDAIWFGIPSNWEDCRVNGQSLEATDILCRPGSTQFELVTPAAFDMLGIVVREKDLMSAAAAQGIDISTEDARQVARLRLPEQTLTNVRYLIRRIVQSTPERIDGCIHRDLLMMALLETLERETPNGAVPPSYLHRKAVVERIKDYVEQACDLPVTMAELCELACVSRRTLQYSFESILGISPLQFLRVTRLNRVKRMLSTGGSDSVSDAAGYNGFYHLSQFSADYKQLFGELPSQTLAKSPTPGHSTDLNPSNCGGPR